MIKNGLFREDCSRVTFVSSNNLSPDEAEAVSQMGASFETKDQVIADLTH